VTFFIADLYIKIVDTEHLDHLLDAKDLLNRFLMKCSALGLLDRKELENLLEVRALDRQTRIERHRKEKEVAARLGELCQRKKRLLKHRTALMTSTTTTTPGEGGGDREHDVDYTNDSSSSAVEEIEREYQCLFLEQCVRRAVDKLLMCTKEIELLSLSQTDKGKAVSEYKEKQNELKNRLHEPPIVIQPSQVTERERILENMFRPHNPPTMTMDQYIAAHPEEFSAAATAAHQTSDEEAPQDLDDKEDTDAVTYKKRAWDDWTDTHPKGYGNRKGNIG
jgi:hypothetical protein